MFYFNNTVIACRLTVIISELEEILLTYSPTRGATSHQRCPVTCLSPYSINNTSVTILHRKIMCNKLDDKQQIQDLHVPVFDVVVYC